MFVTLDSTIVRFAQRYASNIENVYRIKNTIWAVGVLVVVESGGPSPRNIDQG